MTYFEERFQRIYEKFLFSLKIYRQSLPMRGMLQRLSQRNGQPFFTS